MSIVELGPNVIAQEPNSDLPNVNVDAFSPEWPAALLDMVRSVQNGSKILRDFEIDGAANGFKKP
jgi:hypothetical protein